MTATISFFFFFVVIIKNLMFITVYIISISVLCQLIIFPAPANAIIFLYLVFSSFFFSLIFMMIFFTTCLLPRNFYHHYLHRHRHHFNHLSCHHLLLLLSWRRVIVPIIDVIITIRIISTLFFSYSVTTIYDSQISSWSQNSSPYSITTIFIFWISIIIFFFMTKSYHLDHNNFTLPFSTSIMISSSSSL